MLKIKGLCKKYGNFTALDNLDLAIGRGEIFGFVGPNGAGKTTTLKPVLTPFTAGEKITYVSSDKKRVSVSSKGVVKGLRAGKAKITVKSGKQKITITVTVK